MEAWGIVLVLAGVFLLILLLARGTQRQRERECREQIHKLYGTNRRAMHAVLVPERLKGYYKAHPSKGQLDDTTWNDLGMDAVFQEINRTRSFAGGEVLYHLLRTPCAYSASSLSSAWVFWEAELSWLASHAREREELSYLYACLGEYGCVSLYQTFCPENFPILHTDRGKDNSGDDTREGKAGNRPRGFRFFDMKNGGTGSGSWPSIVGDLLIVAGLALMAFSFPFGMLLFCAAMIGNLILYFTLRARLEPYLDALASVKRLLHAAQRLEKWLRTVSCAPKEEGTKASADSAGTLRSFREAEERELSDILSTFARFRRLAVWGLAGSRGSGNPFSILFDYVNMFLHLDLLSLRAMLKEVELAFPRLDRLVWLVGLREAELSVSDYRASLENGSGWCAPDFGEGASYEARGLYHPLLGSPVKNSFQAASGVLVTGSNASGKSTFLRTVAVNAVLAQTIHTCCADSYRAGYYRIVSSMQPRDDLEGGESYYMAEIRRIREILDVTESMPQSSHLPVLCVLDEVLRGTNTVERIAASTQILNRFCRPGVFCLAATHDIELTVLLADRMCNMHFEETLTDGEIHFDYRLSEGPSPTKNAILLLEAMGYPAELVRAAGEMAQEYASTGIWNNL